MSYIITPTYDENGDMIITFPPDVLKSMNIGAGSEVTYESGVDGEIVIKRKNPMKLFAVETISTFRHVYFVSAESAEHAEDTVACNEGSLSYFQKHVNESITTSFEADPATMLRLIQETEQPNLTAEQLADPKWQRSVHVVDYTK